MSFKGGYKIIDFSGCVFTKDDAQSNATTNVYTSSKAGIYDEIESSYGKQLMIAGLVLDGTAADENVANRTYASNGDVSLYVHFPTTAAITPEGKVFMGSNAKISANDKISIIIRGT